MIEEESVRNYEIRFACRMRDGSVVPYTRVIAVADHETAERIAYAMIGERVDADQTLDSVGGIEATERGATVPRTPDGYYALWGRVFRALDLDVRSVHFWYGAEIGLGTNPTGHVIPNVAQSGEPEIVGFFPWPTAKEPHETEKS
jgi:hypothetical protein